MSSKKSPVAAKGLRSMEGIKQVSPGLSNSLPLESPTSLLALGGGSVDTFQHTELPAHWAGALCWGCLWRETEPPGACGGPAEAAWQ